MILKNTPESSWDKFMTQVPVDNHFKLTDFKVTDMKLDMPDTDLNQLSCHYGVTHLCLVP